MAADKKKVSEKKTSEKKGSTKKAVSAAKPVAKKGKKKLGAGNSNVTITVPKGGQIIKYFNLMPALPTTTAPGDWIFTEDGSTTDIATLTVGFPLNPSALEREFERAILVISIQQNPQTTGTWRFALGGVATDNPDEDPNNDIALDIIDNGYTMLVYVQVLENSYEQIPFGFVASFTDAVTGAVSIYESKDPGIIPIRPI
jgi:hypothetical protein